MQRHGGGASVETGRPAAIAELRTWLSTVTVSSTRGVALFSAAVAVHVRRRQWQCALLSCVRETQVFAGGRLWRSCLCKKTKKLKQSTSRLAVTAHNTRSVHALPVRFGQLSRNFRPDRLYL